MAEKTLAEPLNGKEFRVAVADYGQQAIYDSLARDCYLQEEKTYQRYGGTVTIRAWVESPAGRVEVHRDVTFGEKEQPADVQEFEASYELDGASPNATRIETGQPVPTITKDEHGRPVVKGVQYSRRKKAAQ